MASAMGMTYDLIPESYLADIARAILAWSDLEQQFHMFLLMFFQPPAANHILPEVREVLGLSLKRQVNAVRQHAKSAGLVTAEAQALESVLSKLISLRAIRDDIAHARWSYVVDIGPDDRSVVRQDQATQLIKSWKDSKPHTQEPMTHARLKEILQRMRLLYWELFDLVMLGLKVPLVPPRP